MEENRQTIPSAVTDLAFFAVLLFLARWRLIGGEVVASILSAYAAGRFGVAFGKQTTRVVQQAASIASSTSTPSMRAVAVPAADDDVPRDPPAPPPAAPARPVPRTPMQGRYSGVAVELPEDRTGAPPTKLRRVSAIFESPFVTIARVLRGKVAA